MKINNVQNYQIQSRYNKNNLVTNSIDFKGTGETASQEEEGKKSKFSFKKATNILGVAAWLTIVATGAHKMGLLRKNSPEKISSKAKRQEERFKDLALGEKVGEKENLDDLFKGHGGAKFFYKLGTLSNKAEKLLGKELYNNFTYAFGTLFVMPAVVLWSPIGKKDSSKSDKWYTVMRQPLSVAATLTMQATFDRMFDKYTPKLIEDNLIESDAIKAAAEKNGGKIPASEFFNIKYNLKRAKEIFKNDLLKMDLKEGGLNGLLNAKDIESLLELPPGAKEEAEVYSEHFKSIYEMATNYSTEKGKSEVEALLKNDGDRLNLIKKLNKLEKANKMDNIKNACEHMVKVSGFNQLAKQTPKVLNNVLVSSVLGCTFLNVIYGKTMKAIESNKAKKNAAKAKEVA